MRGRRDGIALVTALVGLLALTFAAHGALALARAELAAAGLGAAFAQARAAADLGLDMARRAELPPGLPKGDSVGVASGRTGAGRFDVVALRLGRELWRLESQGRSGTTPARYRSASLVWTLEPAARAVGAKGALVLGPRGLLVQQGTVAGAGAWPGSAHADVPAFCAPWASALDSLGVTDWVPVARAPAALGHLTIEELSRRLPEAPGGAGSPEPVDDGVMCEVDDPWNWGEPRDPAAPCADHLVRLFVPGDLRMAGGVGQGLLVVAGDLTLDAGASFHGVIVAGGSLTLTQGASVTGAAIAGRRATLAPGARVTGSACWMARAVDVDALRSLFVVPGGALLEPL